MKASLFYSNGIAYSILLVTISSVNAWTSFPIGNTFIWWVMYAIILFFFIKVKLSRKSNRITEKALPISVFLGVVVVSFLHGCLIAEYYWDWKLLVGNLMVFLMPLAIYAFSSPVLLRQTFRIWFRYALFLFPIFMLVIQAEAYGRYLVPISVLFLFFAKLPLKWKYVGLLILLFIMITSPDSRSNVIKFIVPLMIGMLYYLKGLLNYRTLRKVFFTISLIFIISPFIFFALAISNVFNVFNMTDYLDKWANSAEIQRDGETISLLDDTRTFIYEEEINSAIKNNYWLWGRSMARGYDTDAFAGAYEDVQNDTNRIERQSSEVSIMNIFNYFGLIGVFVYFSIFLVASYRSIFKSKNTFMGLIGIYVAFRWFYAWVEDFNQFDLNYLFLWILIGMCFSKLFNAMNDTQFVFWIRSLFYPGKMHSRLNQHQAHHLLRRNVTFSR